MDKPVPKFFIHRNFNKHLVAKAMNNINWEPNDDTKDLSKTDAPTMRQMAAMQLVARMREAADKYGAGFVGGFVDENGNRFMMSNLEEGDIQEEKIKEQLEEYRNQIKGDEGGWG